jgi:hypothetical protein
MTPAERVVVEAAVRWVQSLPTPLPDSAAPRLIDVRDAVDALLAERAGPRPATVPLTWGQVVEGDQLYRAPNGGPAQPGQPGNWHEVLQTGLLGNHGRVRIHVKGLPRPIEPEAHKPVIVRRGKTGQAVDALGGVLWSGPSSRFTNVSESEEA